jgi:hypothetical protein
VAQNKTVKVAQNETQSVTPPPPKLAQFEPKSLALTDRNHWHNSNRNSQYSVIACWCKKSNLHEVVIVVHLYLHYNLSRIYKKWIYG